MRKYVFRKYDNKYRFFFTLEKKRLARAIGSGTKIEHVGSTAVPNLGGKGILDLAIGVTKSRMTKTKNLLKKAGYEFREQASTPERLFFRRDYRYKNSKRMIHVHLSCYGSRDWRDVISFRDYLMQNSEAVKQYAKIKKTAVKIARGDGKKYRKHKEKFIAGILGKVSG